MNLKEAIIFAQIKFKDKNITSAPLDAEVLLLEALNKKLVMDRDRSWLYMNLERYTLTKKELAIFKSFVQRREKYEPIAYIIQKKEFYGLDFFLDKNVLIPRVETEIIVDNIINVIKESKKSFTILDVGTGSGCIIISTLTEINRNCWQKRIKKAFANDISHRAIKTAKKNAKIHKLYDKITFLEDDLERAIEKMNGNKNLIITANLPYISYEDYKKLSPNVKNFEPKIALTTKDEGFYHIYRLLRKFAAISPNFNSFYLFLEADPKQMTSIERFAKKTLKCKTETIKDLRGKKRTIKISKK